MFPNDYAGANRCWRLPFRCRGSRRESAVAQLFSLGGKEPMSFLVLICLVATLPIYELVRAIRALKRREKLLVVITEFAAAALFGILALLFFNYLWGISVFSHIF